MKVAAVIPVRMASSRFPGKPLKPILGKSMIEHVWRRAKLCDSLNEVIIATCDEEIRHEAQRFGARVVMTSDQHESCVDRVEEAAQRIDADIIINLQGDMPLVHPDSLSMIARPLRDEPDLLFSDMVGSLYDENEVNSANVVKVVFDLQGYALYYSREPIPSFKKLPPVMAAGRFKQFGINAYRRASLSAFSSLSRTPLEKMESVDMLRLLEHGFKIRVVVSEHPVVGVDTDDDLKKAAEMMRKDIFYQRYK